MVSTLQEKTAALRRHHILDAAATVFAARGFDGASIRDIATAAGVADGTIYNVFENKDALLMALLDRLAIAPHEVGVSPELLHSNPSLFFKHLLEQRLKAYTPLTMGILRVVMSQALIDAEVRKKLFDIFLGPALKGIEPLLGPVLDDNPDRALTTPRLVLASIVGLNVLALLDDDLTDKTPSQFVDALADMLWRGVGKRNGSVDDE